MQINELFKSFQGEGIWVGREATFIRFAGCNLKCKWCDTEYAQSGYGTFLTPEQLIDRIEGCPELESPLYILTGGEPMVQSKNQIVDFLNYAKGLGKDTCIETNGTIIPTMEFTDLVDLWSVSPKLYNSGNPISQDLFNNWQKGFGTQFKFVIQNEEDMIYLKELLTGFEGDIAHNDWVIQPEASVATTVIKELPGWVMKYIPKYRNHIRYIPQVHKLLDIR
jgi:organic radical activating enzyme